MSVRRALLNCPHAATRQSPSTWWPPPRATGPSHPLTARPIRGDQLINSSKALLCVR